jgi:two-component system, OmpR family, phosphate regulon response regulator PhoB
MSQPRLLIIEDERGLTQTLEYNFRREGYDVVVAYEGMDGLRKAQVLLPDVVILDLMLPGMNGLEICRALRALDQTRGVPILMLTAKAEEADQVTGFSLGADDYVTKPFSVTVLVQRVKALQRRSKGAAAEVADVIEYMQIRIDRLKHKVSVEGRDLTLTPTEFRLLESLIRQPGRAFTRLQLIDAAIGGGSIVLERTIDVHVKSLRRKLGRAELIETVQGVGYRFREGGD